MKMKENTFGMKIKEIRKSKGMGLREMARQVGVSPTYLSRIESEKEQPPSGDRICKIAEILDIDKNELLQLADKAVSFYTEQLKNEEKFPELLQYISTSADTTALINNLLTFVKDDRRKMKINLQGKKKGK